MENEISQDGQISYKVIYDKEQETLTAELQFDDQILGQTSLLYGAYLLLLEMFSDETVKGNKAMIKKINAVFTEPLEIMVEYSCDQMLFNSSMDNDLGSLGISKPTQE